MMNKTTFIKRVATATLPTPWGTFDLLGFQETQTQKEHIALVMGNVNTPAPVLTRIHSECLTGDALFSLRCDCGFQLQDALHSIAQAGRGVLLYMRQEGRGIGLINKIKAYALQDEGMDTVQANQALGFPADQRDYQLCAQILTDLGVSLINLMTNNPKKVDALKQHGIKIDQRIALQKGHNTYNDFYIRTKVKKLGHLP